MSYKKSMKGHSVSTFCQSEVERQNEACKYLDLKHSTCKWPTYLKNFNTNGEKPKKLLYLKIFIAENS